MDAYAEEKKNEDSQKLFSLSTLSFFIKSKRLKRSRLENWQKALKVFLKKIAKKDYQEDPQSDR